MPLLGGPPLQVFASPATLTVQKLGVLYDAHPAFALPEWYSYGPLTITDSAGNVVFEGTAATYDDFLFPANGDYKAELTVWRLPENMLANQFEGGSTGQLRRNARLEKPARPTGWYYYSFRFTLQASAEVELSAERMEQGGTVAAAFTGMVGETAPTVETDLGNVQAVRLGSGWRAYIPAACTHCTLPRSVSMVGTASPVMPEMRTPTVPPCSTRSAQSSTSALACRVNRKLYRYQPVGLAGRSRPKFLRSCPVLPPSNWVMTPPLGTRHAVSSALYSPFAGKRKFWYSPALPANSTSPAAFWMVRAV